MTEATPDFSAWIGRQERAAPDPLDARLLAGLAATLAPFHAAAPVIPGAHWCLSPPMVPASGLGPDGHPARGGFLPPVALPRRMWASGSLEFLDDLRPGDAVERLSTVEDVAWKSGRTGTLCFVTVGHLWSTPRGPAIRESQALVYRPAATGPAAPAAPADPRPAFGLEWQVPVDPVLLFRYSALTFNGHRIHYDEPYARLEEHYPGLVIHGPLQATLMLNAAVAAAGRMPRRFAFRGVSPACGPQTLSVGADLQGATAALAVLSQAGVVTMTGQADWD